MPLNTELIKQLRQITSCSVMDCKKALEQSGGDLDKAKEVLRKRGMQIAAQKSSRSAQDGCIASYVHFGGKLGVLVEVNSETDFVAKNEEFVKFAKDIAMQVAATNPQYIKKEDVPKKIISKEKDKETFLKQSCLLEQPFIKNQAIVIKDYLNSTIAKLGENIIIRRFVRFRVGEE